MMQQRSVRSSFDATATAIGVAVVVCVTLTLGGYALGREACQDDHPPVLKVRGMYDVNIARECVLRGDAIVLVLDLDVLESGGGGENQFACASGGLQSLTERATP